VREIKQTIEAGASKIITEGRESGTTGVFRGSGEIRTGLIEEIIQDVPVEKFIFEAPIKSQQTWFIKQFGPDVNLGNIAASEVISLETLRLGLRSDTFLDFHPISFDKDNAK
jgi:phosphosulfolactate synthase